MSQTSSNLNRHGSKKPNESTRLLCDDEEHAVGSSSTTELGPTPLPKAQLGALVFVRMVDPIAQIQIFPYINQRLADLHVAPPEQVGFYSGLMESAYALAQMFSVYYWGRLSDVVGRRPVVILTHIGIAIATISFGFSESFLTLLASRFIGGLAGNIAVLHSILGEISDDTNQNIIVPIYSLTWSSGAVIGSLIGGTFANAATRYPKYFSWPIFLDHPYLPPCLISAMCALLGVGIGYLFIKETLPKKQKDFFSLVSGRSCTPTSDVGSDSAGPETEHANLKTLLMVPAVRALTFSGFSISFLSTSFNVLFTLFCYSSLDAGGLGLQPSVIGNLLAFSGTFAFLIRLVVMPYILSRFDYATIYSTCACFWPLVFASLPILNALALILPTMCSGMTFTHGLGITSTRAEDIIIWICLALVLAMAKVATISFNITMLLVKRHASNPCALARNVGNSDSRYDACSNTRPGLMSEPPPMSGRGRRSTLGQSNGLMQLAMSLGRAIGPVFSSTLFTALNGSMWTRRWGIGWTWSLVMVCLAMVGVKLSRSIR